MTMDRGRDMRQGFSDQDRAQLALVLGAFAVSFALFVLILWAFNGQPGGRLVAENFCLVREGMTLVEVEQLLGGPAGNYGRNEKSSYGSLEAFISPPGPAYREWTDDSHSLEIYFDTRYRVVGSHQRAIYRQTVPRSYFNWLWRALGVSPSPPD